ncbi:MAG: hypothetical protein U0175_02865 [Caldilineaceae bacterium]
MLSQSRAIWKLVDQELSGPAIYLLPLRLFIGIGWIRAGMEKVISPGWPTGHDLSLFFQRQLASGHVVYPFYQYLITHVFTPHVVMMSWIILVGQLLVGLAVLSGTLTNIALLAGLFMNINFVLAGAISPSAFYIVIQVALLVTEVGAIYGIDRLLSRRIALRLLVAQPDDQSRYHRFETTVFLVAALAAVAVGAASVPYIQDYSPRSVDDPAMLMLVLSVITGMTALVKALQIRSHEPSPAYDYPIAQETALYEMETAATN